MFLFLKPSLVALSPALTNNYTTTAGTVNKRRRMASTSDAEAYGCKLQELRTLMEYRGSEAREKVSMIFLGDLFILAGED